MIWALYTDPALLETSGRTLIGAEMGLKYGIRDEGGRQPASCRDTHNVEPLARAYHEDGIDEHGFAVNPGPEYARWANKVHAKGSLLHTHNITTHTCEIDGASRTARAMCR